MRRALLHVVNLGSTLLPQTRGFGMRRILYRLAGLRIGKGARINGGVVFQSRHVIVGEHTWIGRRTEFAPSPTSAIRIGARCDISQDVLFVTGSHEIGGRQRRAGPGRTAAITVGEGCWIGARAVLLGGTALGPGSIVAAGAVVTGGAFGPDVLIAGIPARVIRSLDGG